MSSPQALPIVCASASRCRLDHSDEVTAAAKSFAADEVAAADLAHAGLQCRLGRQTRRGWRSTLRSHLDGVDAARSRQRCGIVICIESHGEVVTMESRRWSRKTKGRALSAEQMTSSSSAENPYACSSWYPWRNIHACRWLLRFHAYESMHLTVGPEVLLPRDLTSCSLLIC
jgi:hypothetical protein